MTLQFTGGLHYCSWHTINHLMVMMIITILVLYKFLYVDRYVFTKDYICKKFSGSPYANV